VLGLDMSNGLANGSEASRYLRTFCGRGFWGFFRRFVNSSEVIDLSFTCCGWTTNGSDSAKMSKKIRVTMRLYLSVF